MMKKLLLVFSLFIASTMFAPTTLYALKLDTTVAVNSSDVDFTFSIKPNPSNNYLNVIIENSLRGDYKIEVYDVLGKLILDQQLSKMQTSIPVSSWKAGVYLVKISNDNHSQTKRFLKQ